MPAKKKVVHIIAGLNTGGAEMMLYKLLSRRDRYDERVICLSDNLDTPIAQKILALDVRIEPIKFSKTSLNLRAMRHLQAAIRSLDPDVIHGWMYHGSVAATVLSRWAPRAKLMWNVRHSLHDIRHERPLIKASINANKRMSGKPQAIVYNSKTSAGQHAAFGFRAENSAVLPNGFDCEVFAPDAGLRARARQQLGLHDDTLAIGVVARYHPMKGHDVCLRAVASAVQRGANLRLFLIGAGLDDDNQPLAHAIRALGIEDQVTLLGEHEQLENLYRMLDVLVSSSLWGEAFSNSIGEAMACAQPTIVTDVGDSAWIVGDSGVVVKPGDVVALAAAIEEMARAPIEDRRRRGAAARARVVEHFSIEHVAQLYDDLYERLTAAV